MQKVLIAASATTTPFNIALRIGSCGRYPFAVFALKVLSETRPRHTAPTPLRACFIGPTSSRHTAIAAI